MGFQLNFTGVISTNHCCAHHRHVPLPCTKLPPELKIEKSFPAFTSQNTDGILTKLYRSDQYHPWLCRILTRSASLHKMAVKAINRKILSGFYRSSYWWDFNETSHE
jgi:hypothetical protein